MRGWIGLLDEAPCELNFGRPIFSIGLQCSYKSCKVGRFNGIVINKREMANAQARQILHNKATDPPQADHSNMSARQSLLANTTEHTNLAIILVVHRAQISR